MPDNKKSETQESTLLLCPGQGAQFISMGEKALEASETVAKPILEKANDILGFDLLDICLKGPEDKLNRTDIAQPAIYAVSVAGYNAAKQTEVFGKADMTAGLSLGEFTALHLAGCFSFEDGLKLVHTRGKAMQEAAEQSESGMVALIGADEARAQSVCAAARGDDCLVVANLNCPGQVVISGSKSACDRATQEAEKQELKATELKVAGAFHSPLMQPAADKLAKALDEVAWELPQVPVLSNVTGKPHEVDINSIKKRLIEQLTSPVRWADNMSWAIKNLSGKFIELPPGKVLSGLMRRIDRNTKVERAL